MKSFLISLFSLILCISLHSQESNSYQIIVSEIGDLESNKDPKCHATASRLEDFMFGTPLSTEARDARINFQKNYVKYIWVEYSKRLGDTNRPNPSLFKEVESSLINYYPSDDFIEVTFSSNEKTQVSNNDLRQFGSIAYGLRAILAVEQSFLFEETKLASLDENAVQYFKNSIDIAVLAMLKKADEYAKRDNVYQIENSHITKAVKELFPLLTVYSFQENGKEFKSNEHREILELLIKQKIDSYQQYNKINQSVFLRNIQVYFSRIEWPKDNNASDSIKMLFTETMIQFSKDLLKMAQSFAINREGRTIEYLDAFNAVQVYLPHLITNLEDVVFFPKISKEEQINIESYDFDAFRDSGWHWQYLLHAFRDENVKLGLPPNPFALEMIVEGIAQFAVLFFRVAGNDAKSNQQAFLHLNNFRNALHQIQGKITQNSKAASNPNIKQNIISAEALHPNIEAPFVEVSNEMGVDYSHRSSDWLARLIRSYVVKEDENLARISIPPAFGGGGVATEDIDNDGWVDILLLGGFGNKLLKNNKGNSFIDITNSAGLDWKLDDNSYAEPRQPIIADFNNDGLQDIFISYVNGPHHMYENNGNSTFKDVTNIANLGGKGLIGGPATALDFNNDGLLDIYIGYFGNFLKGELPTLKRSNTNGSPNKLFLNLGDFKFEDVSSNSGIENRGWTQAVGHCDINNDGWQDIIVGNDFGRNAYYINQKDGTFEDNSYQLNTDKPSYSMGIGITDLNRDLYPDFYISNIVVMEKDDKYVLPTSDTPQHFDSKSLSTMRVVEANDLFISSMQENTGLKYESSLKIGRGFSSTGWSWDADFFDFDLDGDEDLYCLTGMNPYSIYGKENYEYYASNQDSIHVVFADSQGDNNVLFENRNGMLEIVENSGGLDYKGTSRSASYFDFDNDGDLDVIVNDFHGKAKLFRNTADLNGSNWVKLKFKSNKEGSTKDAIGAKVTLITPDGHKQIKELFSTIGYLSSHSKILHFGLAKAKTCTIEIQWPNGEKETIVINEINREIEIIQD